MSSSLREHFARVAMSTVQEVGSNSAVIDQLIGEGQALGLSNMDVVAVLETVVAELSADGMTDLHLAYDASAAAAGVAGGTTLVVFRVTSVSTRSLASITISIQDPERGVLLMPSLISALPAGAQREAEVDLALHRVGRQTVRIGFVELTRAPGDVVVYRIADPIPLTIENSASARTHIQTISQTIQTHGGGVISTGDLAVAVPACDVRGESRWQALRLMVATESDISALRTLQTRAAMPRGTAAPRSTEDHRSASSEAEIPSAAHHAAPATAGSKTSAVIVNIVMAFIAIGGLFTVVNMLVMTFR